MVLTVAGRPSLGLPISRLGGMTLPAWLVDVDAGGERLSEVKGYPFEVQVPDGLPVEGVVLADQARSLDWRARGAELLCTASRESTSAAPRRLETLVGQRGM